MIRSYAGAGRYVVPAILTFSLLAGARAHAANELCGQTITQSVTLTANQACTGQGLIVGADGITIDLAGFTLSGDAGFDERGVNLNGHTKVTIANGTISGFFDGVVSTPFPPPPQAVKLSRLVVRDNARSGTVLFVDTLVVDRSSFINNGTGVMSGGPGLELGCKQGKITSSTFVGNGADGLNVIEASHLTITKAVAALNGASGLNLGSDESVTVQSSTFARNGTDGIVVFAGGGALKIARNTIVGNGSDGVRFTNAGSGALELANVVAGNLIAGNTGNGIEVDATAATTVSGNRLSGNGGDGVAVTDFSVNIVVKGNAAVGNGGHGISNADSDATVFVKNTANANGNRGLFGSDVIDGGGNKARANGALEQCSPAIVCPPAFTPKPGPVTPTCGMHVTTSITLGADTPLCTSTSGIFVDADDVTINLNGHRLQGNGGAATVGISAVGRNNVKIMNGVVQGFELGLVTNGQKLKVVNVEFRGHGLGGALVGGSGVVVSNSVFVSNSGAGLFLQDGTPAAKVSASFFVNNDGAGLLSRAANAVLTTLTSTDNASSGLRLENGGNARVSGGTFAGNADGIVVLNGAVPTTIRKAAAFGNVNEGIETSATGVGVAIGSNSAAGNGEHGIRVAGTTDQNVLTKNAVIGNGSNGLFVETLVLATSVTGNTAVGNANFGIKVDAASSALAKNAAVANLGIGIATAPGATDGGGNKARDNAGVADCLPPITCQ
jgi:parallel beta-helix repeat protein